MADKLWKNSKPYTPVVGNPYGTGSGRPINVQGPTVADTLLGINQFLPVTGDIQSGIMAAQDVKQGNYGSAALNSLGLLPFIPAMGGILKVPALQEAAKAHFGTTYFPAETGYLMDDLSRLDFTGRHYTGGYNKIANRNIPEPGKPDYLKLQRSVDHRELDDLVGNGDNWQRMSDFMDKTGAVRYDINYGVSLVNKNKPNDKQIQMIVDDFRRKGNPLLIDVDRMSDGGNLASKEFTDPTFGEVKSWLDRQYKLHGDK